MNDSDQAFRNKEGDPAEINDLKQCVQVAWNKAGDSDQSTRYPASNSKQSGRLVIRNKEGSSEQGRCLIAHGSEQGNIL